MDKIVLSIDQCKELIALGVDMSDASLMYIDTANLGTYLVPYTENADNNVFDIINKDLYDCSYIEAYTFQDIIRKFKQIEGHIIKIYPQTETIAFVEKYSGLVLKVENTDDILLNAFNMLKWCVKNKYVQ